MPFNVISDAPASLGFMSGFYRDGSPMYVGTGDSGCGFIIYQNPTPALISTKAGGRGAYSTCSTFAAERFDNQNAKFFLAHSSMKWVTTTRADYASVSGKIGVTNGIGTYNVGRVNITEGSKVFQQIGKIETGPGQGEVWFYNPISGTQQSSSNYDVLTC
jgi:hypothetical protein